MLVKSIKAEITPSGDAAASITGTYAESILTYPEWDIIPIGFFDEIAADLTGATPAKIDLTATRGDGMFPYYFQLMVKGVAFELKKGSNAYRKCEFAYRPSSNLTATPKIIKASILAEVGKVCFYPTKEDFLVAGDFEYDIQVESMSNTFATFAKGKLTITGDINNI